MFDASHSSHEAIYRIHTKRNELESEHVTTEVNSITHKGREWKGKGEQKATRHIVIV